MAQSIKTVPNRYYRERTSFAKIPAVMDVPNLIAIQTESFDWFKNEGLGATLADISPIESTTKDMCVEFGDHYFGEPKYTVEECRRRDCSYQAPLYAQIRFINRLTGEIKEQEVFMGDFPMMTPQGTFIINGTERVIVSQLVRSPGVYFSAEHDRPSNKLVYNAKVIPSRGSWLEFETDKRDVLSVRIDRKRKQPATLMLRALGLAETRDEIVDILGSSEMVLRTLERDPATTKEEALIELYKRFRPGEPATIDSARTLLDGLFFNSQRYNLASVGRYKMNKKLHGGAEIESSTLTQEDIVETMKYIVALHDGEEGYTTDDIDHFGNRRIRVPHGARRARAHEHAGARRHHPDEPDEHPPDRGGHQGVLRFLSAFPVHGPVQPGRRHHAQAPPVGTRPGRPVARARRLRGPRRPHLPLRPHVPHRDA